MDSGILFSGNETIDSGTFVFSNDQIQTFIESGDTTLSDPFEFAEYPLLNTDSTYDSTLDEEIFSPMLNCDNDNDGLVSIELKDVLQPSQDQMPVLELPVDNQILVLNQPERNVRFRYLEIHQSISNIFHLTVCLRNVKQY